MEGVMYIVAWIHRRNDDKSVDIYPMPSEKYEEFKTNILNHIKKQIGMDTEIRKTLEFNCVGHIETPVVVVEIINGDFFFVGKVWRT